MIESLTTNANLTAPLKAESKQVAENDEVMESQPPKETLTVPLKAEPKVSKTPSRSRKRQASAVESQAEQVAEKEVFESVQPKASSTVPSKTEPTASKTPNKTRKRHASAVESQADQAEEIGTTEKVKAKPTESESTNLKTSNRTRKRQVSAVEQLQSDDVSDNDELDSKVMKTRTRKAQATPKPGPSTAPTTRKRKASVVEHVVGDAGMNEPQESDDNNRETTKTTKINSKSGPSTAQAKVPKTRKRKASVVEHVVGDAIVDEPQESDDNNRETTKTTKANSRKAHVEETVQATVTTKSTFKAPKTRKRQASEVEHHDGNVSESSHVSEAESLQSTTESVGSKTRKRTATQDPPAKVTKGTRSVKHVEFSSDVKGELSKHCCR